jgi:RHS repeat-associated protein
VATVTRYSDLTGSTKVGDSQYQYDDAGRLKNLQHRNGSGTTLENYTWTYDNGSRVTSETLNGTTTSYTYDDTNELTSAGTFSYDYNLNGNRDTGYTTTTGNRMTNDGVYTYTWDDEGNLTKKSKGASAETWTFAYDNRNQLIGVEERTTDGGGTLLLKVTYAYDVFNNQIQEDKYVNGVGTTTRKSVFADVGSVLADLDGSNNLTVRYLRQGVGEYAPLAARVDSGGVAAWILGDRQDSVRNVVNASGSLIATVSYDGFGGLATDTSPANAGRFGAYGYAFDRDTNLAETLNRTFGVSWGGWLQQDPIRWDGGDTNLRRYAQNNPTNLVDPSGLDIILLLDPTVKGVLSPVGHSAILISSRKNRTTGKPTEWTYASFSTGESTKTNKDNWDIRKFGTLADASKDPNLTRYAKFIYIVTHGTEDENALAQLDKMTSEPKNYAFFTNNCAVTVQRILAASGHFGPEFAARDLRSEAPNKLWEEIWAKDCLNPKNANEAYLGDWPNGALGIYKKMESRRWTNYGFGPGGKLTVDQHQKNLGGELERRTQMIDAALEAYSKALSEASNKWSQANSRLYQRRLRGEISEATYDKLKRENEELYIKTRESLSSTHDKEREKIYNTTGK